MKSSELSSLTSVNFKAVDVKSNPVFPYMHGKLLHLGVWGFRIYCNRSIALRLFQLVHTYHIYDWDYISSMELEIFGDTA